MRFPRNHNKTFDAGGGCGCEMVSAAIIEALGTHMLPLLPTAAPLLLDMATALCQENENDTDEKDIGECVGSSECMRWP